MNVPDLPSLHRETVRAEWVDYNGHMNVAFYVLIFDQASDALLAAFGIDDASRERTGSSVFVAEAHITYDNEVMEGEQVRVVPQILDHDEKRLHLFQYMIRARDGVLAATTETMVLHVNLNERRVCPWPDLSKQRLDALAAAHASAPRPDAAGRVIGIRRRA